MRPYGDWPLCLFHHQLGSYVDGLIDRPIDGAGHGVDVVGALRRFALFGWQLQVICDVDAFDDEDVALFFDFTDRV